MTTTTDEINRLCPHCAKGHLPTYRKDTYEWVHSWSTATSFTQTICQASEYRKATDG